MNFYSLVRSSRTVRRFHQNIPVARETLRGLVDLARLAPSGSNMQALKYKLTCDPETNAAIFPLVSWAGYLKDWPGPVEGERPAAYITIVLDTAIHKVAGIEHGIAAQTIMLGAAERSLGGCIIGSFRRAELREVLGLDERYELLLVLALGRPLEQVVLEELPADGSVVYWRDEAQVHHVPKRSLDDLILP